ncbi:MAG TPA: tetratricopeptide repeat protein [Pyrinomonadaceae bacterium]|nr:tetratricopeptide repeat protein [Pyrinomonadaceae bacterium]
MTALLRSWRTLVVVCALPALVLAPAGCRKGAKPNSNANAGGTAINSNDPEQARRNAQSLVDQGKELYKNDQDEQAAEKFKQAINQDPDNAEAHVRLGMSYAALENKDESEAEYKKSVELFKKKIQNDPKDGDAFFLLGEAHTFLHQDEDATRAYRQATKLKPEDEEAWYRLGMAETRLAQYPEASSAFQKALELDPNDSRASDGLENAQEGTQRIKEGKKHAEDMLKKQQENANGNGNLNGNSNSKAKPTPKRSPGKPF